MKQSVFALIPLFFLAACRPAQQPAIVETVAPPSTQTSQVPPTDAPVPPATTQAALETSPEAPTPIPVAGSQSMECTVVSSAPDPDPTVASLFQPVNDQDWSIGPDGAPVTIIEYGDFQ